jgi:hypothetical protein
MARDRIYDDGPLLNDNLHTRTEAQLSSTKRMPQLHVRHVSGGGPPCQCGKRSALHVHIGRLDEGGECHFLCADPGYND